MGIFFSGSELFEVALGIERNGMTFYQTIAERTKNKDVKAAYDHLASEEKKHLNTFQGMLKSVGDYRAQGNYTEEYMLYLKALIDSNVFTDDKAAKEMAGKASKEAEALHIGITAEKDSILFYSEMRDLVRESDRHIVDAIIGEEKAHLRQLSQLKAKLQKT